MQGSEHGGTALGQVLFDTGAKAEMGAAGVKQHATQTRLRAMRVEGRL
jgi:hypothetical protein